MGFGIWWWPYKYVNALRAFVRIIAYPSHSSRACPLCDVDSLELSLLAHTLSVHTDSDTSYYSVSDIPDSLRPFSISVPDSNSQGFDHDMNLSKAHGTESIWKIARQKTMTLHVMEGIQKTAMQKTEILEKSRSLSHIDSHSRPSLFLWSV